MKDFKFISKKKKEKIKLFEIEEENYLSSSFRTEITANTRLTTEGCLSVIEYTDYYIKIKVKKGYMTFTGTGLAITYYENKTLTVCGKINNIEFML